MNPFIRRPPEEIRQLFQRAKEGDSSILSHPMIATVHEANGGDTPLHLLARAGTESALKHHLVARVFNSAGETPLYLLARAGCAAVLEHPWVAGRVGSLCVSALHGIAMSGKHQDLVLAHPMVAIPCVPSFDTALHRLAQKGFRGVLAHPEVGTVKCSPFGLTPLHFLAHKGKAEVLAHPLVATARDNEGQTPLHFLAWKKCKEVLSHPRVSTVRDNRGQTPLHLLAVAGDSTAKKMVRTLEAKKGTEVRS